MAAPYAFLDILANAPVRDAYLAGRITLILSADLETVLWANGAAARFMGFGSVAESLQAVGGFDAETRRQIRAALRSGEAVPISGAGKPQNFLAGRLSVPPLGEAVFLRSVAAAVGRGGPVDLTEGLSDETSEAALLDLSGRIMYADNSFNPAVCAEPGLKPLLEEAYRDGAVKKRFLGTRQPYPVGVLLLNKAPPVFLVIAAKSPAAEADAETAAEQAFVFNPQLLPARFVWSSDAAGVFTEISAELAQIAGAAYGAVAGHAFADLAEKWQMDKDGAVRALLQSGNPWSWRGLDWPIEGNAQRLRVELSALPAYSADRRCIGFRGFGLIEKVADSMSDERQNLDNENNRALSAQEQEAFFAIARSLRQEQAAEDSAETEREAAVLPQDDVDKAAAQDAALPARDKDIADLRYQRDRLNFLLNALSEAVLIIDKAGRILSCNEAAARLFGREAAQLRGSACEPLFSAGSGAALRADIRRAEERQSGVFLNPGREAEGLTAAGETVKLRLNFGCLEQGKSYFLLMRDMTRFHEIIAALLRKNNEEAQAFKRQARYLALISHEIRTPLNAIIGMAQFMDEEKAGALGQEKYRDYIGDIVQAGKHIMSLVNDILAVSQDKADWLKMDIKPVSLFALQNEVLALMIPQANAANIIIRSAVAGDLPPVLADARAVKQILLNLIGNAVRYSPQGGQIIISAHMLPESAADTAAEGGGAKRRLLMRISDSGFGMSEQEIARARHNPLEAETAETGGAAGEAAAADGVMSAAGDISVQKPKGAGLGLPMAHILAEANAIRLSLTSEPGKGTIAALVFPVAENAAQSEEAEAQSAAAARETGRRSAAAMEAESGAV